MKKPRVIILRTAGTNCDWETEAAFRLAGANPERVHINRLIEKEKNLRDYDILVIPGRVYLWRRYLRRKNSCQRNKIQTF